jgi:Tol biopolymer transport system component/imidazolonepropionase-like amidohydrolase
MAKSFLLLCMALSAVSAQNPDAKPAAKKGLTLTYTGKTEFVTDEGTWLSVDVSKDGSTILFDLLGDLYTLPISGGTAKRITQGPAYDSQPSYSPDATMISFVSDRDGADNLWIAKADGSAPRQLTHEREAEFASPTWSPDGEYVIISKQAEGNRTYELWMYNIHGGSGVQVTKSQIGSAPPPPPAPGSPPAPRLNFMGAFATRDGKYFYYAKRTGGFQYNATFPMWQVARRDRATGEEDVVTSANGSGIRPVVSPDGTKLVFGTRYKTETGLRIRDLKTGDERWLKYPVTRDDQESRFTRDLLPGYAFLPDGKSIVVSYGGKLHRVSVSDDGGKEKDEIIPFTAQVSLDTVHAMHFPNRVEEGPLKARLVQQPVLSPDGNRIAFSALTHLYLMDLAGGSPQRVGDGRQFYPCWSPDGKSLAYVTWSDKAEEGGQIFRIDASSPGKPQQVTRVAAFYRDLAWSPDGARIVALRAARQSRVEMMDEFGARNAVAMDVVWVPASGGDATLVAPARGVGSPHFAAASDRVYFYSPQGLLSMRFDGTDRRTILKVQGRDLGGNDPPPAQNVRISPDGKHALAQVNNLLYVLSVPEAGGDAPAIKISSPSVPTRKLTNVGADSFGWSQDGKTITWVVGSTFYREQLADVTFEDNAPEGEGSSARPAAPEPRLQPNAKIAGTNVTIEVPRYKPEGTIVFRNAQIITMRGDEVIEGGDLLVKDNRIVSVGKKGSFAVPAGVKVMDMTGMSITPGFVDSHAHWTEIRRGVLDLANWSFFSNLAYGVTAGRDPQTSTNDMFAYQDLVESGEMVGPRAYSTGPGVFSNTDFRTQQDALDVISRYSENYRTHLIKSYMVGNREQRQFVLEACEKYKIMPTTEGGLDLKLNLTHAIDGYSGNEHSLPIVPLYKDVIEVFAKSGIAYTPTLLVAYGGPWAENYFYETTEVTNDDKLKHFVPENILENRTQRRPWFRYEEYSFPKIAASAAKIMREGGIVAIGSHGQLQGLGYHWEMWALNAGGLTSLETLRAATLNGAKAIGMEEDLGSIEPGKMADLVFMASSPLTYIRNTNSIKFVMKNGELFDGATLDRVYPRQVKMPKMWWNQ